MFFFYSGNSSLDKSGNTHQENLISSVWYLNSFSGLALPLNIMFVASPCKFVNAVRTVLLSGLQTDFDILFKLAPLFLTNKNQNPLWSCLLQPVLLHLFVSVFLSLCLCSKDILPLVLDSVFTVVSLLRYFFCHLEQCFCDCLLTFIFVSELHWKCISFSSFFSLLLCCHLKVLLLT